MFYLKKAYALFHCQLKHSEEKISLPSNFLARPYINIVLYPRAYKGKQSFLLLL